MTLDRTRTLQRLAGSAILVAGLTAAPPATSQESTWEETSDWLSENFEVHGFLRSRYYTRIPDWENSPEPSSLRTELNLETELRLFERDDWRVGFYSVVQPVYEAVYDFNEDLYGRDVDHAAFNTAQAFPTTGPRRSRATETAWTIPRMGSSP